VLSNEEEMLLHEFRQGALCALRTVVYIVTKIRDECQDDKGVQLVARLLLEGIETARQRILENGKQETVN
jgi:hypothetical protein